MTTTVEQVDRADIVEALLHHNATARRCPRHWVARLDVIHDRLNDLLTQLEQWDQAHGQATAPHA